MPNKLHILILTLLATAFPASQAKAAEIDVRWQDGTLAATAAVLQSIKTKNEAVGLAAFGAMVALTGQDTYAVKIQIKNTTWHSLTLYASEFTVGNGDGDTRTLFTFLHFRDSEATYAGSLELEPGDSRIVYGVFAAPYRLGSVIRRGSGNLSHPKM